MLHLLRHWAVEGMGKSVSMDREVIHAHQLTSLSQNPPYGRCSIINHINKQTRGNVSFAGG